MAQCGHSLVALPSLLYYAGQLRFGGFAFDCHKVGPEQKNIFFPLYAALACNIKDIDYRFLPHGKQILHSLEPAFESTDLGPVSFEFDSAIAIEILIHHEDSPSRKNGSLCARLFEVWLQILWGPSSGSAHVLPSRAPLS